MSFSMPAVSFRRKAPSLRFSAIVSRGRSGGPRGVRQAHRDDLVRADAVQRFAVEDDPAPGGLEQPGQGAQCRRLAGAVGADEGDDLTGFDAEGDALDGFDLAVGDLEVLHLQ